MNVAVIEKKQLSPRKLNLRQDMFCKLYATDPYCLGNGTDCYKKVYGDDISYDTAKASATKFLTDDRFTARINEYLELDGFNNETVDKHHLFLIKQKKDMNVSMKGIQEYNKLKRRIDNSIQLIMPKPLLGGDLEDDEVIHRIDKKNFKTIEPEND